MATTVFDFASIHCSTKSEREKAAALLFLASYLCQIPKELGQIPALEISLNLSCNQLFGEIPSEFSDLDKLGILDISYNQLTGKMDMLAGLQNLILLNISFNGFSRQLPDTPFFRKLPLNDLMGNKALYIAPNGGVVTPAERGRVTKPPMKMAMSIPVSARAVLLLLLAVYLLVREHMRANGVSVEDDRWDMTLYQKFDFSIDDVVRNLTSANVIGTGSSVVVFRVAIPNGETLAVKKMWSSSSSSPSPSEKEESSDKGEMESGAFRSEIRTLGSIRHRNIVRLLGWFANRSRSKKLLFYVFDLLTSSASSLGFWLQEFVLLSIPHFDSSNYDEPSSRYQRELGFNHEPLVHNPNSISTLILFSINSKAKIGICFYHFIRDCLITKRERMAPRRARKEVVKTTTTKVVAESDVEVAVLTTRIRAAIPTKEPLKVAMEQNIEEETNNQVIKTPSPAGTSSSFPYSEKRR
ncbi:LRR receptor-like serine/threonine-protein kinase RGI3 [Telopea speciosissima]|uniref:LRR receptor-like serine/threonine-protein kinase RGI3 n=1 Tax=Telopea speciosissima TaxID=54955 RepID=UPI001CC7526F|nr:LRR receptor-like serine/threonine-protein kinase RGI3 [Telopea speciosissima]